MDFLSDAVLIDTSAVIALHDPRDQNHQIAKSFFDLSNRNHLWVATNATKQESYTRVRYSLSFKSAITIYSFLSNDVIFQVSFDKHDEVETMKLLKKYKNEKLSFHDALCARIMIKLGIYKIFTFDSDFNYFGFDILPLYLGYQ